ncbi:MAG: hypothetical protein AAF944_04155 [Bacteroidota bacterium]
MILTEKEVTILGHLYDLDGSSSSIDEIYKANNLETGDERKIKRRLVSEGLIKETSSSKDRDYYKITMKGEETYEKLNP